MFDFAPVLAVGGEAWVCFETLTRIDSYRQIAGEGGEVEGEERAEAVTRGPVEAGPSAGEEAAGQPREPMASEAVQLKLVHPSQTPGRKLPLRFTLGGNAYELMQDGNEVIWLVDGRGVKLGDEAIVRARRIYLSEQTLRMLGMKLSYAPTASTFRLVGRLVSLRYDASRETLIISTLLPTRACSERVADGTFRVVLASGIVVQPEERALDPVGNTRLAIGNLPGDRLELRFSQQNPTGFKLYSEREPTCFLRMHFANHFSLVDYSETASGEIAVDVEFSRPTDVQASFLTGPPRLVLDFASTIYDEATKRIPVKVGGVREIRVGQFQREPPTVRVVVELKQTLNYRVLREGAGERYYVQFYRGELRGGTVLLDAGHGGSDPGAIGVNGAQEKDIAIAITKSVEAKLKRLGYRVYLTRSSDRFVSLGERADYANRLLPAIYVSIHANWMEDPRFSGMMAFHFAGSVPGQALAAMMQRHLVGATGAVDRGVRTANFFVLRETVVPAVLIETGFISNAVEEMRLRDPGYQSQVADGIAGGIDEYFRMLGGYF